MRRSLLRAGLALALLNFVVFSSIGFAQEQPVAPAGGALGQIANAVSNVINAIAEAIRALARGAGGPATPKEMCPVGFEGTFDEGHEPPGYTDCQDLEDGGGLTGSIVTGAVTQLQPPLTASEEERTAGEEKTPTEEEKEVCGTWSIDSAIARYESKVSLQPLGEKELSEDEAQEQCRSSLEAQVKAGANCISTKLCEPGKVCKPSDVQLSSESIKYSAIFTDQDGKKKVQCSTTKSAGRCTCEPFEAAPPGGGGAPPPPGPPPSGGDETAPPEGPKPPAKPALDILKCPEPAEAEKGKPYTGTPQAQGGIVPYTWDYEGSLQGLNLDPNTGVISGTPLGDATFTLKVKDNSQEATKECKITVKEAPKKVCCKSPVACTKATADYFGPKPIPAAPQGQEYECVPA